MVTPDSNHTLSAKWVEQLPHLRSRVALAGGIATLCGAALAARDDQDDFQLIAAAVLQRSVADPLAELLEILDRMMEDLAIPAP